MSGPNGGPSLAALHERRLSHCSFVQRQAFNNRHEWKASSPGIIHVWRNGNLLSEARPEGEIKRGRSSFVLSE